MTIYFSIFFLSLRLLLWPQDFLALYFWDKIRRTALSLISRATAGCCNLRDFDILKLLPGKDEPLMVRRNFLLVLDWPSRSNGVAGLHL